MNEHRHIFGQLFARPSAIEGAARLLDFGGTLQIYNESCSARDADMAALRSDWRAVGDDMRASITTYEQSKGFAKSA